MNKYDLSLLTIDDFPAGFKDIVTLIGIKAAYKLCVHMGGNPLYIPKEETITSRLRDLNIKKDYKNGLSFTALVKKYNLSLNQIRLICQYSNLKQLSIHEYLDESE